MDGMRQPVGELPPQTYWRRRAVLAAGAVLLILVMYFLITSPSGDSATNPNTSADATVSPDPSGEPNIATSRDCTAADVTITTVANPFTSGAPAAPSFDVDVVNNGDQACRLSTGADGTELLITSGADRIWSSVDCHDSALEVREFILQPEAEESFTLTWPRTRSEPDCQTITAAPGTGFYWATLTVQGIESEPVQFELA